jgi:essential nuclear protein 1
MPKVTGKVTKGAAARAAAAPMRAKPSSSSKKKKKSAAAGPAGHSASLEQDLEKLANPGKLKPIRAVAAASPAGGKTLSKEEQKLENQLLLAGKAIGAAGKKKQQNQSGNAQLYGEGGDDDDAMDAGEEEDDEDAEGEDEPEEGQLISARMSKKILQQVHAQQREEEDGGEGGDGEDGSAQSSAARLRQQMSLQQTAAAGDDDEDDDEDDDDEYGLDEAAGAGAGAGEDMMAEEVELSAEDAAALDMFVPSAARGGIQGARARSLAEDILDKMRQKEAAASGQATGGSGGSMTHGSNVKFVGAAFGAAAAGGNNSLASMFGLPAADAAAGAAVRAKLDPKIVEVYTKVGKFLSHYSSGKVPKAFKLVPNLRAWEEVLFLTAPESWTAQAHLVATRIFASTLNPRMAQRFYALVLLPKVRSDIESHKHLNFHLYQAIKKALYKPAAFFKGLLLPLAEEGATAREAVIMASILSKCTIPVLHASVAMLKLAQMPFSGTSALFLRTLINKKYSLPRKVLSALVQYFCGFLHSSPGGVAPGLGACPLIWHQTLLAFVQRYKNELSANQVAAIRNLVKVQQHHAVTTEIRRELLSADRTASSGASGASSSMAANTAGAGAYAFGSQHLQAALAGAAAAQAQLAAAKPQFTSLAAALQNPVTFNMES